MDIRNNIVATEKFVEDYLLENQSDWNQSDPSQKNYIKNRTHYTIDEIVLFDGEVTFDSNRNSNDFILTDQLIETEEYYVKIGTEIYHGVYGYLDPDFGIALFNSNNYNSNGQLWHSDESNTTVRISNLEFVNETVNVKVYKPEYVKTLHKKYLPDEAVQCNSAEVGDIIMVKSVNDNGIPVEWEAVKGQTSQDQLYLKDRKNGYDYLVYMENGSLTSVMKTLGIRVSKLPDRTDFTNNEKFDPTGMVVVSILQDGSELEVTEYEYDMHVTTGSNTHEIRYTDLAGTVHTVEIPITTRTLEMALVDFEYTTNNDGTYTLTAWKRTLNGEPSTRMLVPNSELVIV